MNKTVHCSLRQSQRAIPDLIVELLMNRGNEVGQKGGSQVIYFDSATKKSLRKELDRALRSWDKLQNAYLVEANGSIVTVGHDYALKKH
jgi:hypothetical protein